MPPAQVRRRRKCLGVRVADDDRCNPCFRRIFSQAAAPPAASAEAIGAVYADAHDAPVALYWLSWFWSIVGLFFVALLVGYVSTIIMHADKSTWEFRSRTDRIKGEMRKNHLPVSLQVRIKKHYDYLWVHEKFQHLSLLNDARLPRPLRRDIGICLHGRAVLGVPFLDTTDVEILGEICLKLQLDIYLSDDVIFREGEVGRSMFVIKEGMVEVLYQLKEKEARTVDARASPATRRAAEVMCELRRNDYFGELAIVSPTNGGRRKHSARAGTICELLRLSKADFLGIIHMYPDFEESVRKMVEHQTKIYRREHKKHRKRVTAMLSGSLGGVATAKGHEQRMRKASLHATVTSPNLLDGKFRPIGSVASMMSMGDDEDAASGEGGAADGAAAAGAGAEAGSASGDGGSSAGVAQLRAEVSALAKEMRDSLGRIQLELMSHREMGMQ